MAAGKVPAKAWRVVFSGTAINLCLGILYAWSVWAKYLKVPTVEGKLALDMVGQPIPQFPGWEYLSAAQASTPFSLCVIIFALLMIPGGRIQDRLGPKVGAITGGLFLALGCIIAGLSKSYAGLIIGFGIFGGIGMGIGYAAPTPAALKWFGPHQRGLVAGLVVSGYGGAALYVSPLGEFLIRTTGLTGSFIWLGILFAVVTIIAGSMLAWPEPGYVPPAAPGPATGAAKAATVIDWNPSEMIKTWQFYALVWLFIATTQSGLLIIANAAPILGKAAKGTPFLVSNAWILASYGGLINALGRIGTGKYSDIIGRDNAYTINCLVSALCLFLLPWIIASGNLFLLFLAVGIAYWQYGGGLSLLPSYTADFFGPKNLGMNYGLVFLGWGLGFFMTRLGGTIEDITGSLRWAFYLSAIVLIIGVIVARAAKRPMHVTE
ncbi:MAG: MFS transporter [Deltaproteobacteria bacterium]|nr:MFS transporter [Deltaproteobacteria bacterium]